MSSAASPWQSKPVTSAATPFPRTAPFGRVLLKLSGEALMGDRDHGVDPETIDGLAQEIVDAQKGGLEIALVIGAGNIVRGMEAAESGMDRATADYAGMLATVLNSLTVQDALERHDAQTRVLSAITVAEVAEPYIRRALEIGAEAILMAKNGVEGVYDGDPRVNENATLLPELTHLEAIERGLRVMDTTALSLCMDNGLPIHVFELAKGNIKRIVAGERVGTLISTSNAGSAAKTGVAQPKPRNAGSAAGKAGVAQPKPSGGAR